MVQMVVPVRVPEEVAVAIGMAETPAMMEQQAQMEYERLVQVALTTALEEAAVDTYMVMVHPVARLAAAKVVIIIQMDQMVQQIPEVVEAVLEEAATKEETSPEALVEVVSLLSVVPYNVFAHPRRFHFDKTM